MARIRDYGECRCSCHQANVIAHCFSGPCCERENYKPERIKAWLKLTAQLHKLFFDNKLNTREAYEIRNALVEPWNNLIDYEREQAPRHMRDEVADFIWGSKMNRPA